MTSRRKLPRIRVDSASRVKSPRLACRPRILVRSSLSACGTRSWASAAVLRAQERNAPHAGSGVFLRGRYQACRRELDARRLEHRPPRNEAHSRNRGQFPTTDAGEHGRIGDLEPVEMEVRKNRAIASGIEKLVGVPTRGKCARFRLAIPDDAGHDQIRIVERRAEGMNQRISEFTPFMDRPRRFRCDVAGDAVRPRELSKQPLQPIAAALDTWIALGIGPF
jgi:hypothetical protein